MGTVQASDSPDPNLVVGFDPGLHRTGYAVVDISGRQPALVEAGLLRIPANPPLSERLRRLHENAFELLREYQPAAVAVEDLYSHYERPRTAILMGHARGVLLLAAAEVGAEVFGYLPSRVKKSMTGSGRADKEQMQQAVRVQFGLKEAPQPPDVADAAAIALCHCLAQRYAA